MTAAKPDKIFFENLDGWRFFCFLSVFLYHSFHTNLANISSNPVYHFVKHSLFGNGNLGVNFFFVLSGFLITFLLLEEKEQKARINIPYFWLRRILRIWPLYFFCVFFGFVLFPLLKQAMGQTAHETANPLFFLTFTSNFDLFINGLPDSSVLGVLWSVAIEEQFYLVWPLVIAFVPFKKLPFVFAGIVGVSWVFRVLYDTPMYHEYHSLSCMADMAMGAWGTHLMKTNRGRQIAENLPPVFLWALYLLFFAIFFFRDNLLPGNVLFRMTERSITALLITGIIAEQCFCRRSLYKMKNFTLATKLGLITYGLYCLHFIGILTALTITQQLHLNTQPWQVLILETLLALFISVVIAGISYRWFETPFLRLKDRFAFIHKGR
ncbi:acyltransferase [Sphingobacteriales bacterium UPWRP_1]|nr:acyltransferase [Sphingobacteriales bacterium TSM_CSM]PSJ73898.1 acyltransferase [Sphingobacteriales bacterium UPWRP_1]